MALKFYRDRFYLYSNFDFLEFTTDLLVFNELEYGIKFFNNITMANGIFLFIESDIGFIFYGENSDKDKESSKWILRNFFVKSRVIWAEATIEQNGATLKGKFISEVDKINENKTENDRDKFETQLGSSNMTFSFGFDDEVLTSPRIKIDGIESGQNFPKLNRLSFVSMKVLELRLKNLDAMHLITPNFVSVQGLFATHIVFFVYYDTRYEVKDEQKVDYSYDPVFYSLDKMEVSFRTKIGRTDSFRIFFKKTFSNGHLCFKKETDLEVLESEEYETPLFSNNSCSELDYVYTYLKQFHWSLNGMLAKSGQNEKQKVVGSYLRKTSFLFKTNEIVFVVFLFCLGLLLAVLFWLNKMRPKKKKLKLCEKHK